MHKNHQSLLIKGTVRGNLADQVPTWRRSGDGRWCYWACWAWRSPETDWCAGGDLLCDYVDKPRQRGKCFSVYTHTHTHTHTRARAHYAAVVWPEAGTAWELGKHKVRNCWALWQQPLGQYLPEVTHGWFQASSLCKNHGNSRACRERMVGWALWTQHSALTVTSAPQPWCSFPRCQTQPALAIWQLQESASLYVGS